MIADSDATSTGSLQYGEGAFSIITGYAVLEPYYRRAPSSVVYLRAREHALRDHMLHTIHPDIDLEILSKTTAGRAASVLVAIVSNPRADESLFVGDPKEGITFVDPQRIISESPKRFTPAVGAFIATYVEAVIK